jgi:hypothetical protein
MSGQDAMERTTMPYTLATAAAVTGLKEAAILRAIKSGKISGRKNAVDEWEIEPAELHRIWSAHITSAQAFRWWLFQRINKFGLWICPNPQKILLKFMGYDRMAEWISRP